MHFNQIWVRILPLPLLPWIGPTASLSLYLFICKVGMIPLRELKGILWSVSFRRAGTFALSIPCGLFIISHNHVPAEGGHSGHIVSSPAPPAWQYLPSEHKCPAVPRGLPSILPTAGLDHALWSPPFLCQVTVSPILFIKGAHGAPEPLF